MNRQVQSLEEMGKIDRKETKKQKNVWHKYVT